MQIEKLKKKNQELTFNYYLITNIFRLAGFLLFDMKLMVIYLLYLLFNIKFLKKKIIKNILKIIKYKFFCGFF